MTALAETWLLLFLLLAGAGHGAALALAIGRLLDEAWPAALAPTLRPLARHAPALALLAALPLPWFAPLLFDWDGGAWSSPGAVMGRTLLVLALWWALGRWLTAPGDGRGRGGAALVILAATGPLAWQDWALSRDASWTGSVQGFALMAEQAAAVLGLAALRAWRAAPPADEAARTGIERALLALALAVLWLWFTQYLVAWAANLPPEAAWYARRAEGPWGVVKLGLALPALLGAAALAVVPQWAPWRLRAVGALLLLHHLANLLWLVRPEARGAPFHLPDVALAGLVLLLGARALKRG